MKFNGFLNVDKFDGVTKQFIDLAVDIELLRERSLQLTLTLGTTGDYYLVVPFDCSIIKIWSVINAALTTGNQTFVFYQNDGTTSLVEADGTTGITLTITQAGSAAGDVDFVEPKGNNTFSAGDKLKITVGGTNDATARCELTFLCKIG